MDEEPRFRASTRSEVDAWIAEQEIPPQFRNARFPYHLISLLLRNKPLLNAYALLGRFISNELTISPRNRETLIIRCAVRTESIYEWSHHEEIARDVGLTDKDLADLKLESPRDMSAVDMALVHACDDLLASTTLSSESFSALSAHFDTDQILEVVSLVGVYHWTAMLLKGFHVTVEEALYLDEE